MDLLTQAVVMWWRKGKNMYVWALRRRHPTNACRSQAHVSFYKVCHF